MATLILTAVGTAVGGPIGGAIGALVGQQIDQRFLAPKGRRGPRLGELSIQTSSYGTPIAKLFGRMRVAGTVIWATDLKESSQRSGGGKGSPKTTTYSYSASFAVALSGRRVRAVYRIWADGNLLRGEGGDWKNGVGAFRLHDGAEDQPVDPLIAAVEGADGAPACRGMAYVVFEDLQLGDYGNRIPSLTFEVEADEGEVTVAAIAQELGGGELTASGAATVSGYAVTGDSARAAIETLMLVEPLGAQDDGAMLHLGVGDDAPRVVAADDLGARTGEARAARRRDDRVGAGRLPDAITVSYYEPGRDWQTGLQRAARRGHALRVEARELPAAIEAGAAKAIAERELARVAAERRSLRISLPWRYMDIGPSTRVTLPGDPTPWRVSEVGFEAMRVELLLRPDRAVSTAPLTASAGRQAGAADRVHGPTTIVALDLPGRGVSAATEPVMMVAANGTSSGWRRATISMTTDGGASWQVASETAAPATIGTLVSIDTGGIASLFDDGVIVVELLNDAMWLEGRDDDALIGGANLASLGDELIQFGSVVPLGERRFRLTRLLRGRGGTEGAMAGHAPGERFVLIEDAALLSVTLPMAAIGTTIGLVATGVGDPAEGSAASLAFQARSLRPPAPVHLRAIRVGATSRSAGYGGAGPARNGATPIRRWARRANATGWRSAACGRSRPPCRIISTPRPSKLRMPWRPVTPSPSPSRRSAPWLPACPRRSISPCKEQAMTDMSPRLSFPFLQANQAQKEVYHNEALQTLDALLHLSVEAVGVDTPPVSPEDGQCWIVGDAATGAWAGQGSKIACRSAGGWRFVEPRPGMAAWSVVDGVWVYWIDGAWEIGAFPVVRLMIDGSPVVGARGAAIADPTGGTVVDVQARAAITSLLAALRAHGLIAT